MKKIILSLLVITASMNIMAEVANATFTLSNGAETTSMYLIINEDANPELDCAPLYEGGLGGAAVAPYIYVNGKKYQVYAANAISDIAIGYKVPATGDYTLSVSEVTGTINFIAPDGSLVVLADGQSWNVTATALEVNEAFVINPSHVQTAFVCQVAGGLSFHGDQAYTGLQVLDENDVVVAAAFDLAAGEDKFVAIAAAGRYYIKNGEQKIYFVVK